MEACTFSDFLKVLEPWLDSDYIRKVLIQDKNQLVVFFSDGGQKAYRIDDCTQSQIEDILVDIRHRGINVIGAE